MTIKTRIDLRGQDALFAKFRKVKSELQTKIGRRVTNAGAQVIKKEAIVLAGISEKAHKVDDVTVQPGNLKKNIVVKRVKDPSLISMHVVTVRGKRRDGYAARYARLLEFGTIRMRPYPFLRPAFERRKGQALSTMIEVLDKAVKKVAE